MRMNYRHALPAGIAGAASVALLGGGIAVASPHSSAPAATAANTKMVMIRNFAFTPRMITIVHGSSVRWTNRDTTTHTTTSNTGVWNHTLAPGRSFTFTFKKAGTYRYHCNIHPDMTGTVKVT